MQAIKASNQLAFHTNNDDFVSGPRCLVSLSSCGVDSGKYLRMFIGCLK